MVDCIQKMDLLCVFDIVKLSHFFTHYAWNHHLLLNSVTLPQHFF